MDIPPGGCSCPLFPRRVGISKNGFCRGKKTGEPGEKPSGKEREPTTNSIHMWQQLRESNPDPKGGWRGALSLCAFPAPFSPKAFLLILSLDFNIIFFYN